MTFEELSGPPAPVSAGTAELMALLSDDSREPEFTGDVQQDARYITFMAQYGQPRVQQEGNHGK
jgi:hypothetical protein